MINHMPSSTLTSSMFAWWKQINFSLLWLNSTGGTCVTSTSSVFCRSFPASSTFSSSSLIWCRLVLVPSACKRSITSQYHAGSKCDCNQWIRTYRVKTTTSTGTASPRPHTYTRARELVHSAAHARAWSRSVLGPQYSPWSVREIVIFTKSRTQNRISIWSVGPVRSVF